jgi:hypothetical protein
MQLDEGLLLLFGGSVPQLASLCESILVREAWVLFFQALDSSSVEVDVSTDDLRGLTLL